MRPRTLQKDDPAGGRAVIHRPVHDAVGDDLTAKRRRYVFPSTRLHRKIIGGRLASRNRNRVGRRLQLDGHLPIARPRTHALDSV